MSAVCLHFISYNVIVILGGHSYQISGTGKAQAKHEKYEGKSEIEEYKTAADNTMGKKRKFEDNNDEEAGEKKIKVEETGEADTEVPKKKKKKKKNKDADTEAAADDESGDAVTPAKKSKKRYSLSDCTNVPR